MQNVRSGAAVILAAAIGLAGCGPAPAPPSSSVGSQGILRMNNVAQPHSIGRRELTPQEKKVIESAVVYSIRDAAAAKYRWAKFPILASPSGSVNYCALVNAKSPYPAYNGLQAYIVETTVMGGHVTSAVMGLIAGGKDAAIVAKMCSKYGLNPYDAS